MKCSRNDLLFARSSHIKAVHSLMFLILMVLSTPFTVYGDIPASERAALIALYNSTNGDDWTDNSGWKTEPVDVDGFAMPGTENTWYGISVTGDSVDVIFLTQNNLTGAIPSELGNLINLNELDLNNNQLTGPIPTELGNLINLNRLFLHNNQLTGTIPPELEDLTELEFLTVNANRFTNPPNGTVVLIIDSGLSRQIDSELNQFKTDLNNEGYTVVENAVGDITPPEVRSYLQELYIQTDENLEGAILIGKIPYAYQYYEVAYNTPLKEREVISYQYYSDLDGTFEASSDYVSPGGKDYSFNLHSGDRDWEIWVGVLPYYKGNLTDTVSALKRYFTKNHEYRTCGYALPEAFLQIHEGYDVETMEEHSEIIEQRTNGYSAWTPFSSAPSTRIYFDSPVGGLSIEQGYADLSAGVADFTYTNVHGGESNNGQIMDIPWVENNPVKTAFFFTTGCNGGNLDYADNILTSILYSPTSMVVITQGTTYTTTALYGNAEGSYGHNMASALDSGKNVGQSFLTHVNVPALDPPNDPAYWEYQYAPRIMLGDPTLTRLTGCESNAGGASDDGAGSGSGSGGCFISTAAYGTSTTK